MTILARLDLWKQQGVISADQHVRLASRTRGKPLSLWLELNVFLYAGVLAFVAGLGWTVSTWSHQLGGVLVVAVLSAIFAGCGFFCITRASPWSPACTPAPSPIFDYVLYLGSLVWCIELAYLETRLHVLSGQWDVYLLATAVLFFLLAYRYDNRFVLSLALSSLAGWFGLKTSRLPFDPGAAHRWDALLFCLFAGVGGGLLQRLVIKPHFLPTYLNLVANVLFWALLSGVFQAQGYTPWLVGLLIVSATSFAWGMTRRSFAFVAYAVVYGYVGVSWILLRNANDTATILMYFVLTATAILLALVFLARHVGRSA